jgi:hypothetical protein
MATENPNTALMRHIIRTFFDWLFRLRTPGMHLIRGGFLILGLVLIGWALNFAFPTEHGIIQLSLTTEGTVPEILTNIAVGFAALMIGSGAAWEFHRYYSDTRRNQKRKVIIIELRGLRDSPGAPIGPVIPKEFLGTREQVLIDLRDHIVDGQISNPIAATAKVSLIPQLVQSRVGGLNREDVSYVFGGLAPVPLTFLAGLLVDDEQKMTVLDWDRNKGNWRSLDGPDDGLRFLEVQASGLSVGEVALAVSVSYAIDIEGVKAILPEIPIVQIMLDGGAPDCHWSEVKQQELGKQILSKLIELSNGGATRIHLFLAAQSSMVFRIGRLYDKRNLPPLRVYQYQRGAFPVFPWAIDMPVAGTQVASVTNVA